MPSKNIIKTYVPDNYYHLYTRGVNKQAIFNEEADKVFFLGILKRYLSHEHNSRKKHAPYKSFAGAIDLLAYCLMDNHIHLLVYQHSDTQAITQLMRRVMTTYSMYFNKKYSRIGPLFQSKYLASRIDDNTYLHHISRYIHRNPALWRTYNFTSLRYYTDEASADWVKTASILELFDNDRRKYFIFVASMDGDDEESTIDQLAHE